MVNICASVELLRLVSYNWPRIALTTKLRNKRLYDPCRIVNDNKFVMYQRKEMQLKDFKTHDSLHHTADLVLANGVDIEVEIDGVELAELEFDKLSICIDWLSEHIEEVKRIADKLLADIFLLRHKYSYYGEGELRKVSFRCVGIYVNREYIHSDRIRLVFDPIEDETFDYYGHRYLLFAISGQTFVLSGAEWIY